MPVSPEIFLSYAHADDEGVQYDARGWVQCFYEALRPRLKQARGKDTHIWLDETGRISGASVLRPTIKTGLENAAILITIVSPSYAASKWCEDELEFFRDAHAKRSGLCVVTNDGTLARVFMVNKLPLYPAPGMSSAKPEFLARVPELADSTGYNFYLMSAGKPYEFTPPHSHHHGEDFCKAINHLAYDIVKVLDGGKPPNVPPPSGITVYLADTAGDVAGEREKILGALQQGGHAIGTDLRRAKASIHIVGSTYSPSVEMQYDLAGAEAQGRTDFVRLTWIPPDTAAPADERQAAFMARLEKTDARVVKGAALEDFKTIVKDELAKKPAPPPVRADAQSIYLIFDAPDKEASAPVRAWLYSQGFAIRPYTPVREKNEQNLKLADGVLVYYGQVNPEFIDNTFLYFDKVYKRNRKQPAPPRGVYLADPDMECKHEILDPTVHVIPGFGDFSPEALKPFVEHLLQRSAPRQ